MLFKIIAIGFICVVLALILKQYKPEFSLLVSVCGALIIFSMLVSNLKEILNMVFSISSSVSVDGEIFLPVIKIIGVGYITEFVADIADDSGNRLLSSKIILGGKIAIFTIAIPIVKNLIETILGVIL